MRIKSVEHRGFPLSPALLAVDMVAMLLIALCLPEVIPGKLGKSLGLISPEFAVPILAVAIPLVLFCAFSMVRSAIKGRSGAAGEWG